MISIIDYQSGNIGSVQNALKFLGKDSIVTSDPEIILKSDGVIFPGQGRAGPAMQNIRNAKLDSVIPKIKVPFLGICLGMQLLCDFSEEDETNCLNIIPGKVQKFLPGIKTPHMGWNEVEQRSPLLRGTGSPKVKQGDALWQNIPNQSSFYFVHSYFVETREEFTSGKTSYEQGFVSAIERDNFYGVQFHPEKSGDVGLQFLKNFLQLCK